MKYFTLMPMLAGAFLAACTGSGETLDRALRVKSVNHLKFSDYDPVRIKGSQPKAYAVHGIDISRHNPAVNFGRIKKAGIDFAFMKATEGKDDRDPSFRKYWRAAGRAGVPRSAYHFYYFCASPESQAANFIRTVPKSDRSLPPILDVEWNPKSPTCRKRPSPAKVRNVMKRWLDKIERHYGQKPIIYITVDFYAENLAGGQLPGYQYWLRSVTAEPKYKYGKRPWRFWQYTGTGRVPGVEGKVDINAFNGSRKQWASWVKKNRR